MWMFCPVKRSPCPRPWDCGRQDKKTIKDDNERLICKHLSFALQLLGIKPEEFTWLCPDCSIDLGPKTDRSSKKTPGRFDAAGFYSTGRCGHCGRFSQILQLSIAPKHFKHWYEEVLSVEPETED